MTQNLEKASSNVRFSDSDEEESTLTPQGSEVREKSRNTAADNEPLFTSDSENYSDAEEPSKFLQKNQDPKTKHAHTKEITDSATGEVDKKEKKTKKEKKNKTEKTNKSEKKAKKEKKSKKARGQTAEDYDTDDESDRRGLMILNRLVKLPLIKCSLDLYQQAREVGLLSGPLTAMEFGLALAALPAAVVVYPVSELCGTPIFVVDWCLCKGLDVVEAVCPCLAPPPKMRVQHKSRKSRKSSKKVE